jgi:hypothetical protein
MRYSSRFFLYAPITLFGLIAAAAILHWWLAAQAFSRRLDALNGHAIMPGVTLHFSAKQIAGFPFRLDAVFENFEIVIDAPRGPLTWKSEKFAMHGLIGSRDREIFEAAGQQRLSWTGPDGKKHGLAFLPARLRASSISDARGLVRFDLDLLGAGAANFTLAKMQFHLRRDPARDALDFVASADQLTLTQARIYGDKLITAKLQGEIAPAAPFSALLNGNARWQDAADGWRTAHGRVQVMSGELHWNKADLAIHGALMLDARKKSAGDLRVTANGVPLPDPLGDAPLY